MEYININDIIVYPEQREVRQAHADDIAVKIKDRGYNPGYPITLDANNGLVDGGHRIEAAKLSGLDKVPYVLKPDGVSRIEYIQWTHECSSVHLEYPDNVIDFLNGKKTVYFIQGIDGGNIKIGYTARIKRRFVELQVGSPVLLKLIGAIYGCPEDELRIQDKFNHLLSHGEWYKPADELIDFVRNYDGEIVNGYK